MEDFGNIVYVLAAIGWFLWKAFSKSSEKNVSRQNKDVPRTLEEEAVEPNASALDDMLEQFGVKRKQEVVRSQPVDRKRVSNRMRDKGFLSTDLTHSHLPKDYQMSVGEMQGHRVERQVRVLETEEDRTETLREVLIPDGVDLRQAVVLDAVLNRPYR